MYGTMKSRKISQQQLAADASDDLLPSPSSVSTTFSKLGKSVASSEGSPELSEAQTTGFDPSAEEISPEKAQQARKLFNLPADEDLKLDVFCLKKKQGLYLSGRLYVFTNYICFYSTKWGLEVSRAIPFAVVKGIRKKRHMGASNSIEVLWVGKRTDFINVRNRGQVYNTMLQAWKECNAEAAEEFLSDPANILPQKSENNLFSRAINDLFTVGTAPEVTRCSAQKIEEDETESVVSDDDYAPQNSESVEAALRALEENKPLLDCPEASQAPNEARQLLAEATLDVTVKEFTRKFMLSEKIKGWQESQSDCRNVSLSSWVMNDKLGLLRELNFWYEKKLGFGVNECECHQTQWLSVHKEQHVVMETDQVMPEIPFGDYFSIQSRWDVRPHPAGVQLKLWGWVKFSRSTVFKKQIESSSMGSLKKHSESIVGLIQKSLRRRMSKSQGDLMDLVSGAPAELQADIREMVECRMKEGKGTQRASSFKGMASTPADSNLPSWLLILLAALILLTGIALVTVISTLRHGVLGDEQLLSLLAGMQADIATIKQQLAKQTSPDS